MSRTGKQPIPVPSNAKVAFASGVFTAEGPKGKLSQTVSDALDVSVDGGEITVTRKNDLGQTRAFHGLYRALLANAVTGVTEGFTKELEIHGVGYRGEVKGTSAHFRLGYSHEVVYPAPDGITIEINGNSISVSGSDRQRVGQVAAEIRKLRKPDAYKGKGIRYKGEQLRLKVGKSGTK